MTRRTLRPALALPVLIATLLCLAFPPAPALAKSGKGNDRSQQEKFDRSEDRRQPSEDKRQSSGDQRGNGKNRGSDRGRYEEQRPSPENSRGNAGSTRQGQAFSPQDAAQRARSQYGGQVLKVQPAGRGYEVRLLREDGRVVTVPIAD